MCEHQLPPFMENISTGLVTTHLFIYISSHTFYVPPLSLAKNISNLYLLSFLALTTPSYIPDLRAPVYLETISFLRNCHLHRFDKISTPGPYQTNQNTSILPFVSADLLRLTRQHIRTKLNSIGLSGSHLHQTHSTFHRTNLHNYVFA